ncbi:unnamed protein product [Medioppia subpectinata]|uniref:Uncharacterized protein n=1 Tax=Medioppia subpectinata TaxID=1979941 RepID=A0A7R9KP76_9ACAR|nr:unnamed protein product [Medioppia subpectinata]CAG2106115.1 unnamed protein product [Medioppia subpectinata]
MDSFDNISIKITKRIDDSNVHSVRLLMMKKPETNVTILDALNATSRKHPEYSFTGKHFNSLGFYIQSIGQLYENRNLSKYWFVYESDGKGEHRPTNG